MPFGATFKNDLLKLILVGTAIADLAENDTTSPATNIYVSLHTGDPSAGNQSTSECAYTSYARVAVARTTGGWGTITGGTTDNEAAVTFPAATGGSETASHVGLGVGASGATVLIASAALGASLAISTGVQPEFAIGALDFTLT